MTKKDEKRCVDKSQIGEDVINLLKTGLVIGLLLLGIYLVILLAHIIGTKLIVHPPSNAYRPSMSVDAVRAVFIGVITILLSLFVISLIISILRELRDRYYPMCSDLKKLEKERCKKTKTTKK